MNVFVCRLVLALNPMLFWRFELHRLSSLQHFLLNECILVQLSHVFARVELVLAGLANWNYETPAQTTAQQHWENAEVENHGSLCVHVLHWGNSSKRSIVSVHFLLHLKVVVLQELVFFWSFWFFCLWWKLNEISLGGNSGCEVLQLIGLSGNNLRQISNSVLDSGWNAMELGPQVLLYLSHVTPSGHCVCLNVSYFRLVFLLSVCVAIDIFLGIGIFGWFNNDCSNILRGFNFVYFQFIFKSHLNYIWNRHIIGFSERHNLFLRN